MPSTADWQFVRDQSTWGYGPCLQISCYARDPLALPELEEVLRSDRCVREDLTTKFGRYALAWEPEGLPLIGLYATTFPSGGFEAWTYPPHVERATGYSWLSSDAWSEPRVWRLHAALLALVGRVHARIPLRFAEVVEEVQESCLQDTVEGAVVYSQIAQACGLRADRILGGFAVIPFEAIPCAIP
jgi:hypothetical protein